MHTCHVIQHTILASSQSFVNHTPNCCVLGREALNTNYIVSDLTGPHVNMSCHTAHYRNVEPFFFELTAKWCVLINTKSSRMKFYSLSCYQTLCIHDEALRHAIRIPSHQFSRWRINYIVSQYTIIYPYYILVSPVIMNWNILLKYLWTVNLAILKIYILLIFIHHHDDVGMFSPTHRVDFFIYNIWLLSIWFSSSLFYINAKLNYTHFIVQLDKK